MREGERAWIVLEFANGKRQIDIARDIGLSQSAICSEIKEFLDDWSGFNVQRDCIYNEERRRAALVAIGNYSGEEIARPAPIKEVRDYENARREHAWLLRAEGLTFEQIGDRMGISKGRTRQLVHLFSYRVQRSIRRSTHFIVHPGAEHDRL